MNIIEVLREQTLSSRDTLNDFEDRLIEAEKTHKAAEERVKRASTEISKQRTLETERKRILKATAEKATEAQSVLEDLDRRRQEALDALMACREELNEHSKYLQEAQDATHNSLAEIQREQKLKQRTELDIAKIREEYKSAEIKLHKSIQKGLSTYIEKQDAILRSSFATQEQLLKALKQREELKRARHTDGEVGRLCDERDEIRRLLENATVPGVKIILQSSLKEIETKIQQRFPSALQISDLVHKDNQIEELLFYCNEEGKAVIILPFSEFVWELANLPTERVLHFLCLIWSLIKDLGIKTKDGDFDCIDGRTVFVSEFNSETIAGHSISVKCRKDEVIRYILAPVPAELQKVIANI